MNKKTGVVTRLFINSLPSIVCSVCVGLIFAQGRVFDHQYPAFQFLWGGIVAALFYNMLVLTDRRLSFAGLIVLFCLTLLTTESHTVPFILRDIFYIAGISSGVFLYFSVFRSSEGVHFGYAPFLLGGIFGTPYIISSECHLAIVRGFSLDDTGGDFISLAEISAFYGLLIGFAVGLGVSITNKISRRPNGE